METGNNRCSTISRLIGIVKSSGFKGYIGVEFEGINQSEEDGVRNTQILLKKYL